MGLPEGQSGVFCVPLDGTWGSWQKIKKEERDDERKWGKKVEDVTWSSWKMSGEQKTQERCGRDSRTYNS